MKYTKYLLLGFTAVFSACVEDSLLPYEVEIEKPQSVVEKDQIASYDNLKQYVDRTKNPDFVLGTGLADEHIDAIINGDYLVSSLFANNFDDVVCVNATKHASVVQANGSMNFSRVTPIVAWAKDHQLSMYGHTLMWHHQQQKKYLESLIVQKENAGGQIVWEEQLVDGQFSKGEMSSSFKIFRAKGNGIPTVAQKIDDEGLTLSLAANSAKPFQVGLDIYMPAAAVKGEKYKLKFEVKVVTDETAPIHIKSQAKPTPTSNLMGGAPVLYDKDKPDVVLSQNTGYQTKEYLLDIDNYIGVNGQKQSLEGLSVIRLSLGSANKKFPISYTFKNISLTKETLVTDEGEFDEEKTAVAMRGALEKWIEGMMNACKENPGDPSSPLYVRAWDLVNEPIADNYGIRINDSYEGEDGFYWAAYLGETNYVRDAVAFARKYGASDMLLFVNDYGLESVYNNGKKLDALIDWIQKWEADGQTKLDGIGTQMHLNYFPENPELMVQVKENIVKSFQKLASTGKLIRISELTISPKNNNKEGIAKDDITPEINEGIGQFYKFIIEEFFKNIPAKQRYGITHWRPVDHVYTKDASYRVGLFTEDPDRERKITFTHYAEGLKSSSLD